MYSAAVSNKRMNLTIQPVTARACARSAPGRLAGYAQRYADTDTWGRQSMPVISTFFGIVIRMYYREHGVAHFHAEFQGQQATFDFEGQIVAGSLSSRTAMRLIREWTLARSDELEANWSKARAGEPLERIAPLD